MQKQLIRDLEVYITTENLVLIKQEYDEREDRDSFVGIPKDFVLVDEVQIDWLIRRLQEAKDELKKNA